MVWLVLDRIIPRILQFSGHDRGRLLRHQHVSEDSAAVHMLHLWMVLQYFATLSSARDDSL